MRSLRGAEEWISSCGPVPSQDVHASVQHEIPQVCWGVLLWCECVATESIIHITQMTCVGFWHHGWAPTSIARVDEQPLSKRRFGDLESRVYRIERGFFSAITVLMIASIIVGLFQPFFVKDGSRTREKIEIGLVSFVFQPAESGLSQAERHPIVLGIAAGVCLLAVLVALVAALRTLFTLDRSGTGMLTLATMVLIVGTLGSWFLQIVLYEPRSFALATLWFAVASIFSIVATRFGRYIVGF